MFSLSFMQIVTLKKWDIGFQILAFVAMLICFPSPTFEIGPFALYIVALAQIISCLFWWMVMMNRPVTTRRKRLQLAFLITTLLCAMLLIGSFESFVGFSFFIMLWLGPILGISYFVTSVKEVSFYKGLVYKDAI